MTPRESFGRGVRLGLGYAPVVFLVSVSFGVVAVQAGLSAWQATAMSATVHAGSAQFAALGIAAAGGGLVPAVIAASLMNSRFVAMGVALAPSLPGGPVRRAVAGQALVDQSWALSARGDGTFDRHVMFGVVLPSYLAWVGGTVLGATGGNLLGDPQRLGLDAMFPAFFLILLAAELRRRETRPVAVAGAAIALVLVPFTAPGIPILAASLAALPGLRRGEEAA